MFPYGSLLGTWQYANQLFAYESTRSSALFSDLFCEDVRAALQGGAADGSTDGTHTPLRVPPGPLHALYLPRHVVQEVVAAGRDVVRDAGRDAVRDAGRDSVTSLQIQSWSIVEDARESVAKVAGTDFASNGSR